MVKTTVEDFRRGGNANMYGKIFETMFTGSMMGTGALAFAVWSYVIAHQRPSGKGRETFVVELNAKIIGFLIGEKEEAVAKQIEVFCEPDEMSRSQEKDGRKLVRQGSFLYEVVNGAHYDKLRRECERLEGDRVRHERYRERQRKGKGKPLPGEVEYDKAYGDGATEEELAAIVDRPRRRGKGKRVVSSSEEGCQGEEGEEGEA